MANEISKINVGGVVYNIKDDAARKAIAAGFSLVKVDTLPAASVATIGKIYLVGHTHSGATNVDANAYDYFDEYVTVVIETVEGGDTITTYSWEKIGNTDVDLSNYSQLGHTHTVTPNITLTGAAYTPAGEVSTPNFTGQEVSIAGTFAGSELSSSGSYTPAGTISGANVTLTTGTVKQITNVGSMPAIEYSAVSKSATEVSAWNAGSLPTISDDLTVVTGITEATTTANVVTMEVNDETLSISIADGAITVTPSTTTTNKVTDRGAVPSLTYAAVSIEASKIDSWTDGVVPTSEDKTVAIDVDQITQPTFVGTQATVSVKGTPAGNITIAVNDANEGEGNYIPVGNLSKPTFTGTATTITPTLNNGTASITSSEPSK